MSDKIMLIDGNSLLNRAFYALPMFTNAEGQYTNGVYGFLTMLYKVMEQEKPTHIAVAFDRRAPTFRHEQYDGYKAKRTGMPDEMASQLPVLKEVLTAMNIRIFEMDGYEADDILGTLANIAHQKGMEVVLVTGDRDVLQLVKPDVKVIITKRGITDVEVYDEQAITERYGIKPEQLIDVKGLMGDASDNIPGVPGIGEKTALRLIKQFGSLECVLEHIDEVSGDKLKKLLTEYREQAIMSKQLGSIQCCVPIDDDLDKCRCKGPDAVKLKEIYQRLDFKSLLSKIPQNNDEEFAGKDPIGSDVYNVADDDDIEQLGKNLSNVNELCVYSNDVLSLSEDELKVYNISVKRSVPDIVAAVLSNPKVYKHVYDAKRLIVSMNKSHINVEGIDFDAMIAAYLLDPSQNNYDIKRLVKQYLEIADDAASHAGYLWRLMNIMLPQIKENEMNALFYDIEMPLTRVLADMEINGFTVDVQMLKELADDFERMIDGLTKEIYVLAGEEFNINSPKQLGAILFEKLKLPVGKKTKTGYSTDIEVLKQLQLQHDIVPKIIDYRQLTKLKSTYIDGLMNMADPITHKIHSNFNQTVTVTGRISSTEPNLQNIPVKTELGHQIRKAFVPSSPDYLLLDADYSQIELRVLAHMSRDQNMIDAFLKGQDIHARTASEVFGIPLEQVTPLMRSRAKAVNFGIVYGISDFGLARNIGISRSEAKQYIEQYFARYNGVRRFMDETIEFAKKHGYVTTMFKRRRYLPELASSNRTVRSFGERAAMNTPIQGTAADIIKKAMVDIYSALKENEYRSKLILQVHDELIIEVHRDEVDEIKDLVKDKMESVVKMDVPLVADIHVGENWYDAK
ncbi:MAG: polymerase [Clostridiales bacterium]|jgi:DNA polymerase-1|nr:polymerase [Clostridiales bacterium]